MESTAWAYLLPNIGELFEGTPAGVAAVVWLIMYGFLMYAGNYIFTRYFRAKKHLALLNEFKLRLNDGLEDAIEFTLDLLDKRETRQMGLNLRDLLGNISENPMYNPEMKDSFQIKYISSSQISYYINTRDLMPDLFENKFIGYVPSLLTGFGVLGTFIGIQLGIGGLEFSIDDIEEVTDSITMLLSGSTVAFMTSIWGIFFSLMFSVTEKTLLRHLQVEMQDRLYQVSRNIEFFAPENEIVKMRVASQEAVQQLIEVKSAIQAIDLDSVVTNISSEFKNVMSNVANPSDEAEKSRALMSELSGLIVSELRLIKSDLSKAGKTGSKLNIS